uniref:Uncharacterized protein n=1 Tax=Pseudomonas phage Arace01 TaxID=3138526 RepID=A0AAU6VZM6_9VIRU
MCNKCLARNVVVINGLVGLAASLAATAQTLYSMNATTEQNLVLKRLREVLAVPHEELEIGEDGQLIVPDRADPLAELFASLDAVAESINGVQDKAPEPKEAAEQPAKSEDAESFGAFLDSLLNSLRQSSERRERRAEAEQAEASKPTPGMPDPALAEALGNLVGKLKGNPNVSVDHHMITPQGANPEQIAKMRKELADMLGVAVDEIKVV